MSVMTDASNLKVLTSVKDLRDFKWTLNELIVCAQYVMRCAIKLRSNGN